MKVPSEKPSFEIERSGGDPDLSGKVTVALPAGVTLAALLSLFRPADRVLVIRRMGPHECEVAAVGAAQAGQYAEIYGNSTVEEISLDTDGWTAIGEYLPVLVVTVSEDGSDAAARRPQ